jgi:hypothetical protein
VQLPLVTSTLLVVAALATAFGLPDVVYSFSSYDGGGGAKAALILLLLPTIAAAAYGTVGALAIHRRARTEHRIEDVVLAGLLSGAGTFACFFAAFELLAAIGR